MVCKSSDCQVIFDGKIGSVIGERNEQVSLQGFLTLNCFSMAHG